MLYYCPFLFAVCKCVLFSSGIKFSVPCSCIFSRRNTAQVSSLKPCKSLHCPESLLISREDHSSTFFMICTYTPIFFLYFPLQISAFSGQINLCFFTSTNASCFLAKIVTCILLLSWGTIPNPMRSSHLFKPNTHGDKVTLLWVGIMSLSSEQVALFVSVVVYCYAVFSPLFLKVAHTQGRSRKISIRRPGYPALRHD